MIGLDTNVLVRYLVEDDAEQAARAADLIDETLATGERLFLTEVVVCEVVWVLESVYRFPRGYITAVLGDLLRARQLVVEHPEAARQALDRYAHGTADFADYLILQRCDAKGCERVASFDKALHSEPSVFSP